MSRFSALRIITSFVFIFFLSLGSAQLAAAASSPDGQSTPDKSQVDQKNGQSADNPSGDPLKRQITDKHLVQEMARSGCPLDHH